MAHLVSIEEVAKALHVSHRWVQEEVRIGAMPHYRVGSKKRLLRFDLDEVLSWAKSVNDIESHDVDE